MKGLKARIFVILSLLFVGGLGWGGEEEISFDKITEQAAPPVLPKAPETKFTLMGRIDLTAEISPIYGRAVNNKSELKSLHNLLVFLKLKASPKTSFFGEIVGKTFFYMEYHGFENKTLMLGKILVPFGDTRYFHHFYGGVQGNSSQEGILLPNVWAEYGANLQTEFSPSSILDTYVVNGFAASEFGGQVEFPKLNGKSDSQRQALGARWQWQGLDHVTLLGSVYYDNYWMGKPLTLAGGDVYTDYGLLPWSLRGGAGLANATAVGVPGQGTLERRGDYLFIAGLGLGPGEWRLRYGTFNHIVKSKSAKDRHSFEATYFWQMDVIRFMLQRQWNFEAENEVDNDLWRLMASLDF